MTSCRLRLAQVQTCGQTVLVVGLGFRGLEIARFLSAAGHRVAVMEKRREDTFRGDFPFSDTLSCLRARGVSLYFDIDGEKVLPHLDGVGLAVLSPGVALEASIVGSILRSCIPIVSELELRVELYGGRSVVVTGSNGKSTTASLIHHILLLADLQSSLWSNSVGIPGALYDEKLSVGSTDATLVVEATSYQLEACSVLKPTISVFLNITENHLERHGSLERYAAAKARCLALQDGGDYAVINADDSVVLAAAKAARGTVAAFGKQGEEELKSIACDWLKISSSPSVEGVISGEIAGVRESYDTSRCLLLGTHNRYNLAAAILATRRLGVSAIDVQKAIESFLPLEHRLELVATNGVPLIVNDSKSTTVAATVAAVETVLTQWPTKRMAVLVGGLSKAGSWDPLLKVLKSYAANLAPVVFFGKDGPLLASHCRTADVPCVVATTLKEGVLCAFNELGGEGVLLLSPGCASFDEFKDFEHRGRFFKELVSAHLINNAGASSGFL